MVIYINLQFWYHTLDFFKTNLIPLASFFTSIITFSIMFKNHRETKQNLHVSNIGSSNSSVLIKPDRNEYNQPDNYWDSEYRVISDVVVTNRSSKPISIIEFRLNDTYIFNSYTKPGANYSVTLIPIKKEYPGGITTYGESLSHNFAISNKWLNPIFDVPPYTSLRGYIFFNIKDNEENVKIGKNKLTVLTSRDKLVTTLEVFLNYDSVLQQQDKFSRDSNLFP